MQSTPAFAPLTGCLVLLCVVGLSVTRSNMFSCGVGVITFSVIQVFVVDIDCCCFFV